MERIKKIIGISVARNAMAAALIAGACFVMGALSIVYSTAIGGLIFGCLFIAVGVMAIVAILYFDGGTLRLLRRRLEKEPGEVAWIHVSQIANRLRRRDVTVIVFFNDRTYARIALPKAEGYELFELLQARCPRARQTKDLPLPDLLAHEVRWRKDPVAFRNDDLVVVESTLAGDRRSEPSVP